MSAERVLPFLSPDRPGYVETLAASRLAHDSTQWEPFLRDVVKIPLWTLPAVQRVVWLKAWARAADPLRSIRECGLRESRRMGLKDPAVEMSTK